MARLLKHALRFGIIGLMASAVHFALVIIFVNLSVLPLLANALAFLGAFQISFWGHIGWSFDDIESSHRVALPRFFIVAISGFLLNEMLFALLLELSNLPYQMSLFIVLALVAGLSFLLSRHWAFAS